MSKLTFLPHFNSNFAKAFYLMLLFGLLKSCVDGLVLQFWGQHVATMIFASTIVAMAAFGYVVYLVLELQDKISDQIEADDRDRKNPNQ